MEWFNKQNRLVQILLLLIPGVNWVTEVVLRWSYWAKNKGLVRLIIAIAVTIPSGIALGIVDAIWLILFNKLLLQ